MKKKEFPEVYQIPKSELLQKLGLFYEEEIDDLGEIHFIAPEGKECHIYLENNILEVMIRDKPPEEEESD